ncbi:MAG: response regulator [Lachnospiraceae bacterium]|nr:response regulator [Lachnospiraceae bacterium]
MADWVVIVDDDVMNLKLAGRLLSEKGMRVTALRSGELFLDYVRDNGTPDLVLLDVKMPGMDGFEVLERLRNTEEDLSLETTPVVFISAISDSTDEERAAAAGAAGFIKKPFDPDNLYDYVAQKINESRSGEIFEFDGHPEGAESPEGTKGSASRVGSLSRIFDEEDAGQNALWMGKEAFRYVYRYMMRYLERYNMSAYRALFFLKYDPKDARTQGSENREKISDALSDIIRGSLRNSDIMLKVDNEHYFLFLPELGPENVDRVTKRVMDTWLETEYGSAAHLECEFERISAENREEKKKKEVSLNRIVMVDDDRTNLILAEKILKGKGIDITCLRSGAELFEHLEDHDVNLILLDVNMPGMDGMEVLKRLKSGGGRRSKIPVIFLTGDDDESTEVLGFSMGAMDFVRKPFVPEILISRIRHVLELVRLQNSLKSEVSKKAVENEYLSIHIIHALAAAVDAKDLYTSGHSDRVARYARMIAESYGYDEEAQERIYMEGLLHDVGKIGIPDEIINKEGALTNDEFEIIKTHPLKGAKILDSIPEMPGLSIGAKCHHERYDGRGYPDGLAGDEIPEEARIIAVADSYDAMTSRRSYRSALTQEQVRAELVKGRGTQFDPDFCYIMIRLLDLDTHFDMREM